MVPQEVEHGTEIVLRVAASLQIPTGPVLMRSILDSQSAEACRSLVEQFFQAGSARIRSAEALVDPGLRFFGIVPVPRLHDLLHER